MWREKEGKWDSEIRNNKTMQLRERGSKGHAGVALVEGETDYPLKIGANRIVMGF